MATYQIDMQQRRGTANQWSSGNPVLRDGELGFETDTYRFKLGDGTTAWNSLPYSYAKPIVVEVTSGPFALTSLHLSGNTLLLVNSGSGVVINVDESISGDFPVTAIQVGAGAFTWTPTGGTPPTITEANSQYTSGGVGAHSTLTPTPSNGYFLVGQHV